MDWLVILFYKYTQIDDPKAVVDFQKDLCGRLGLRGRVIVAAEGINGTLEGTADTIEAYIREIASDVRFGDIHFKKSPGTGASFPRLSVKVRNEIVSAHLGDGAVNPRQVAGKYISPEALASWYKQGREFVVVDMRNDYEHKVGHFENSILPPLKHFRELPKVLPKLMPLKERTVVTVCTGGVRCEKASGFLIENGFKDVYQLEGGIVSYLEKYPKEQYRGKVYVFDGRIAVGYGDLSLDDVVGTCERCSSKSERYVNCAFDLCHRHFICCERCGEDPDRIFCEKRCQESSENIRQ